MMSMSLSGLASPRATEPKIAACCTPFRSSSAWCCFNMAMTLWRSMDHRIVRRDLSRQCVNPGGRPPLPQLLLEELDRPPPRQIRRLLVVARVRRVVVEGVVGAFVDVDRVLLAPSVERFLEGVDSGIGAVVEPGIMQQERRLDLAGILGLRLAAVIGD